LYFNEDAKTLVTIFPGGGNDCKRPALFFLTDYFARNNYDVLCISYTNLYEENVSTEEQMNTLNSAIYEAISGNKEIKQYDEHIFVSNSFGNIVQNEIKEKYNVDVKKSIYIAPTAQALDLIKKYPGLIISATEDSYLTKDDLSKLLTFDESEILIFEGGNHGLECDDTLETMDFCKKVVAKAIDFVNEK
jgi:hypothetical protein